MKSRVLLLPFALSICFIQSSLAHKEATHQYIVREAYTLLKLQVGCYPELSAYLGDIQGRSDSGPWSSAYIVAGAWNEDHQDPVYNFGKPVDPFGLWNMATVSNTHFWRIGGAPSLHGQDEHQTGSPMSAPNAYQKLRAYANGGWEVWVWQGSSGAVYRYDAGLINLYQTGTVFKIKTVNTLGQEFYVNHNVTLSTWFKKLLVYNILGRMAHLLGDMSVPTHTHDDAHPPWDEDWYENAMDYDGGGQAFVSGWNATNVLSLKGGYVNPWVPTDDPIHYLAYTTNQIADYFPSKDIDGNNSYYNIGEIASVLSSYGPPISSAEYRQVPPSPNLWPTLINIRDATLPYVIRATAGLLYWFASSNNWVPTNVDCFPPVLQTAPSIYVDAGIAYSPFSGTLYVANSGQGVSTLSGAVNWNETGTLPSDYVTVPAYPQNMFSVRTGQQFSLPYWGNRPYIYVPRPDMWMPFNMYAMV